MGKHEHALTAEELSARWKGKVKPGTLKNWRYQDRGPRFIRVGISPLYPLAEVEKYEAAKLAGGEHPTGKTRPGRKAKGKKSCRKSA